MNRLSVDIGGTFTDVVLDHSGQLSSHKVLTTPENPETGAMRGVSELLASVGLSLDAVDMIVHGTTLATNALIERRGARTVFVTTAGFRDIIEMGYERRFDQYDLNLRLPEPLVPRDLRFTLNERLDADGRVLHAPDPMAMRDLVQAVAAARPEAVAVGLLHAYANPAHEVALADALSDVLPGDVSICLSSEVSPEIREYERFSTVCANAYVRPLMQRYLRRFDAGLRDDGFGGAFLLMLSGGGLTTLEQACRIPIRLVESGPAGGVALAARVAQEVDAPHVLALDMGGTTAKIAFVENGKPDRSRHFEVARAWRDLKGSGLPVRVPTVELVEIGAGGGSIAQRDALGRLAVGPRSAGAEPGPACYGRGGTFATITDANLILGKLRAEGFAQGRFTLDPARAHDAMIAHVQTPLDLSSTQWAAAGVCEVGEEAMANAARVHAAERGKTLAQFHLLASGGAAPLHAVRIAEKLGITRVIIPAMAGVGSAVGFLGAPVSYEVARSVLCPLDALEDGALGDDLDRMTDEAHRVVAPALGKNDTIRTETRAELRYQGQGHAIQVPLTTRLDTKADIAALQSAFEDRYRAIYNVIMPDMRVELVSLSLTASGPEGGRVNAPLHPSGTAQATGVVQVFDPATGGPVPHQLYQRAGQGPGAALRGPCLVQEQQTTTHIPRGWSARVHEAGHLLLERLEQVT